MCIVQKMFLSARSRWYQSDHQCLLTVHWPDLIINIMRPSRHHISYLNWSCRPGQSRSTYHRWKYTQCICTQRGIRQRKILMVSVTCFSSSLLLSSRLPFVSECTLHRSVCLQVQQMQKYYFLFYSLKGLREFETIIS